MVSEGFKLGLWFKEEVYDGNMVSKDICWKYGVKRIYVRNVVSKGYLLEMWCQTICWENSVKENK